MSVCRCVGVREREMLVALELAEAAGSPEDRKVWICVCVDVCGGCGCMRVREGVVVGE